MFRAVPCPPSGGQFVLLQPLVLSLSVNSCTVCRLRADCSPLSTGILYSHKGLSPCDFHLIPKMKEPLRGIRFTTVPEILQAVDRSIPTINTTGAAKGILRLPHRWQRVYTMLVTTLKDSKTSKHVSVLYQL